MTDSRPPLAAFDEETIAAVEADADFAVDDLRALVAGHQEAIRDRPGVEDIVYEWRSQFHEDPLVHRTPAVYVLGHRSHVWAEFAESLAVPDPAFDALRAVHRRQARSFVDGTTADRLEDVEPMVLTRP